MDIPYSIYPTLWLSTTTFESLYYTSNVYSTPQGTHACPLVRWSRMMVFRPLQSCLAALPDLHTGCRIGHGPMDPHRHLTLESRFLPVNSAWAGYGSTYSFFYYRWIVDQTWAQEQAEGLQLNNRKMFIVHTIIQTTSTINYYIQYNTTTWTINPMCLMDYSLTSSKFQIPA